MTRKTDNLNSICHETPEPPYYAVISTSKRTDVDDGYAETAQRILELAAQQPGFLSIESARNDALGITVSYWKDLASIDEWRKHSEHLEAQQRSWEAWYRRFTLRIARVERNKEFDVDNAT